jgi:hypothetical protein
MEKSAAWFWCGAAGLLAIAAWTALDHPALLLPPVVATAPVDHAAKAPLPTAPADRPPARSTATVLAAERNWDARVEAYSRQLQLIEASPEARQHLRDSHFSKDEQDLLDKYLRPSAPTLTRQ